jgi:hypothetical protein
MLIPAVFLVDTGCFGAALMREPALVADLCAAMASESGGVPITVKCRIGAVNRDDIGSGAGLASRLDADEVQAWCFRDLCKKELISFVSEVPPRVVTERVYTHVHVLDSSQLFYNISHSL